MPVLCGQYESVATAGGRYSVATNQWGADGSGQQCLTTVEDSSCPENATSFFVTWNWEASPQLVHAYPNVNLNSSVLPIPLKNVGSCTMDAKWSLAPGSEPQDETDVDALARVNAVANVALDLFVDPDPEAATSTTRPKYEIMVWFGNYGGKGPLGYVTHGDVPTLEVGGSKFKLYAGPNDNGQYVYSWVADRNVTEFNSDLSPLVHYLWRNSTLDPEGYVGIMQFGSETFHVKPGNQVTFNVKQVHMDIEFGTPKPPPKPRSRFLGKVLSDLWCLH